MALGAAGPEVAPVPMILDKKGKKLSKLTSAVSVMDYREDGLLPHALLNYLVRLGWSHGDQEIFSREEMIRLFDIADVNKALVVAGVVVAVELFTIAWVRHRFLRVSMRSSLIVVTLGGAIVLGIGVVVGSS